MPQIVEVLKYVHEIFDQDVNANINFELDLDVNV